MYCKKVVVVDYSLADFKQQTKKNLEAAEVERFFFLLFLGYVRYRSLSIFIPLFSDTNADISLLGCWAFGWVGRRLED